MWSLLHVFLLFMIQNSKTSALSCYQCSMKYTNEECNANNATSAIECQPTFDTCVTIVLKPAILDQLLITKYCTKRKACERQRNYIHSLTPCRPNEEVRSWGCVSCCGDRDLCNVDGANQLKRSRMVHIFSLVIFLINIFLLNRQ